MNVLVCTRLICLVQAALVAGAPMSARQAAPEPLRLSVAAPDYRMEFLPRALAPGQRPLVLALGGGAAKGIAHAGVLQRLQEEGIPVAGLAGTSMGAFMGSMYATGYSGYAIHALLERVDMGALLLDRQHRSMGETLWEQENTRSTFLRLEFEPGEGMVFTPGAASGLDLNRTLQVFLGRSMDGQSRSFDQLRMPFRAVSSDLQTGRAVAPARGELPTVVRASMSIPGMFSPVLMDGHQHVDGMLVQNLPVETARGLVPGAAVLAVEVGENLEPVHQNSILGLAFRSLDVSVEARTEISRRAADVLLRPRTEHIQHLEFHKQVAEAVEAGRRAFDDNQEAIETLLYGPEGALEAPGGRLTVQAPAELLPPVEALAGAVLPPGPRLRRHYQRLLRRICAAGLARSGELRFPPEGPVLTLEPYPVLRRIERWAPGEWTGPMGEALAQAGVRPGVRFNPIDLARALDHFYLEALLHGRAMVSTAGTTFDPADGVLHLRVSEPALGAIRVSEGSLSHAQATYVHNLLEPFENRPVDMKPFAQDLYLAEKRLGLKELQIALDPKGSGTDLLATPVPDDRVLVDGMMAYESTWGAHFGLSAQGYRLFGSNFAFAFGAATDRLKTLVDLDVSRALSVWPRVGWRLSAAQSEITFLSRVFLPGFTPDPMAAELPDRTLRSQTLGGGLFARVGSEDRGLITLDLARKWSALQPAAAGGDLTPVHQVQATFEWDSFDRYLFPTEGTLVRLKLGQGWSRAQDAAAGRAFQFAYLRARNLWPLGSWASLEGDVESGLGWHLPLSQWYSAGGPAFLAGSSSGAFFTPNFAVGRLGLPLRVVTVFGTNLQVIPTVQKGFLGALAPGDLHRGHAVQGGGISLRAEVGRWYCEVAVGRLFGSDLQGQEKTRLNVLVGAHPFDLWRDH